MAASKTWCCCQSSSLWNHVWLLGCDLLTLICQQETLFGFSFWKQHSHAAFQVSGGRFFEDLPMATQRKRQVVRQGVACANRNAPSCYLRMSCCPRCMHVWSVDLRFSMSTPGFLSASTSHSNQQQVASVLMQPSTISGVWRFSPLNRFSIDQAEMNLSWIQRDTKRNQEDSVGLPSILRLMDCMVSAPHQLDNQNVLAQLESVLVLPRIHHWHMFHM